MAHGNHCLINVVPSQDLEPLHAAPPDKELAARRRGMQIAHPVIVTSASGSAAKSACKMRSSLQVGAHLCDLCSKGSYFEPAQPVITPRRNSCEALSRMTASSNHKDQGLRTPHAHRPRKACWISADMPGTRWRGSLSHREVTAAEHLQDFVLRKQVRSGSTRKKGGLARCIFQCIGNRNPLCVIHSTTETN